MLKRSEYTAWVHAQETAQHASDLQLKRLRSDLQTMQRRLDNALRTNADANVDFLTERQRIRVLATRLEEVEQFSSGLRQELTALRTHLEAKLDALQAKPIEDSVSIPPLPEEHRTAMQEACVRKEGGACRLLAKEFVQRYPTDRRVDEALFFLGQSFLDEGNGAAALGEFHRFLKQFSSSGFLGRALMSMGEAYLLLHDCASARLAFAACSTRFGKTPLGQEARAKVSFLDSKPAEVCGGGSPAHELPPGPLPVERVSSPRGAP